MKRLHDILPAIKVLEIHGPADTAISGITADSRRAGPGILFVAVKGGKNDGHDFIEIAAEQKVAAIVCERFPGNRRPGITYIRVKDSRDCPGLLGSAFYDYPSRRLLLTGITGTNGKTTIATLLYRLFTHMGHTCGLISTVENRIGDKVLAATHTTPDAIALNKLLNEMAEAGCSHVFMEVSSHAVVQGRIAGQNFTGGVFTNLTHDHLDYHKTFAAYLKAKKAFFDHLPVSAFALSNSDDKNGAVMLQNTKAKKHYYGIRNLADYHGRVVETHLDGMLLSLNGTESWFRLTGQFNAYNLLAIYATAVLLGAKSEDILRLMSGLGPAEGRFETLRSPSGITGIIDYAHTPDALNNVIDTINQIMGGNGRLFTVVGAGGDRDKTKRPEMARIASAKSYMAILTSDNPRSEDPEQILADMKSGLDPSLIRKTLLITNRREAIRTACTLAGPGDVVLVAGKGHEKYQEISGIRHPFDDMQVLSETLQMNNPT